MRAGQLGLEKHAADLFSAAIRAIELEVTLTPTRRRAAVRKVSTLCVNEYSWCVLALFLQVREVALKF